QTVQQGITVYNNSGKTSHNGVELALSYQAFRPEDNNELVALRPFIAVTYSDFKFEKYTILNAQNEVTASYNGNKLTGIAPWVVSAGIDVQTKTGLYLYGSYFFNDKLPVNDANSSFAQSYQLLNA